MSGRDGLRALPRHPARPGGRLGAENVSACTRALASATLLGWALLGGTDVRAAARLDSAHWLPEAPRNAASTVAPDGKTITTPLDEHRPGTDLFVAGRLLLDTTRGREINLSFLTDVPWVTCEAPKGLVADDAGRIDFVCRARARGLDKLTGESLRVYVKVDPTGGLAHRKLYWVLQPGTGAQASPAPPR